MAAERIMATSQITIDALAHRIGQELLMSEWVQVKQQRIDDFAKVIGDEQWIHVDPLRAAAESPYETACVWSKLLSRSTSMPSRGSMATGPEPSST